MRAMVLEEARSPLVARELPDPVPDRGQVLLAVRCTGVCRTDLHVVDGELPNPKLPLILGHQIVGVVVARGEGAERFELAIDAIVEGWKLFTRQVPAPRVQAR